MKNLNHLCCLIVGFILFLTHCNHLSPHALPTQCSQKRKINLPLNIYQKQKIMDSWCLRSDRQGKYLPFDTIRLVHYYSMQWCSSSHCNACWLVNRVPHRSVERKFKLITSFNTNAREEEFKDFLLSPDGRIITYHRIRSDFWNHSGARLRKKPVYSRLKYWEKNGDVVDINTIKGYKDRKLCFTPSGGFSVGHWSSPGVFRFDGDEQIVSIPHQCPNGKVKKHLTRTILMCDDETFNEVHLSSPKKTFLWQTRRGGKSTFIQGGKSSFTTGLNLPNRLVLIGDLKGSLRVYDMSQPWVTAKKHLIKVPYKGKGMRRGCTLVYRDMIYLPELSVLIYAGTTGIGMWYLNVFNPNKMKYLGTICSDPCLRISNSPKEGRFIAVGTIGKKENKVFEFNLTNLKHPRFSVIASIVEHEKAKTLNCNLISLFKKRSSLKMSGIQLSRKGDLLVVCARDGNMMIYKEFYG